MLAIAAIPYSLASPLWLPEAARTLQTSRKKLAPDFTLTGIYGEQVRLSDCRGEVVLYPLRFERLEVRVKARSPVPHTESTTRDFLTKKRLYQTIKEGLMDFYSSI